MGTFELNSLVNAGAGERRPDGNADCKPDRLRQECIIALKVYDSCRQQHCLKPEDIGPALLAECGCSGALSGGDSFVCPPNDAASVTIEKLRVKKIVIVSKEPNNFKKGLWDVTLKFVIEYSLVFRDACGETISDPVKAMSVFTKKVTMFGSVGTDIVISTDLFSDMPGDSATLDSEPFVLAEAKAVALDAVIRPKRCGKGGSSSCPNEVLVTIGLFYIIKLFRIVPLLVESRGFCVPRECEDITPVDPCDLFNRLDFPMDFFAPPPREELAAGVSVNIPRGDDAGCGCK